jgi:hypothetical protein
VALPSLPSSPARVFVRYTIPLTAGRKRTSRDFRVGPKNLYGAICVKTIRYGPISLFGRAATSPRPDLFFARLLRAAAVKGGRRPSQSDLPLTAASTAADLRDRGVLRPRLAIETIPRGSSPSYAQIARHELVFGRPVRVATTMQSCASAAKLREGGPILNRGARTIVQHRVATTSVHQLQHGIDKALGCSNSVVLMRPVAASDLPASHRLSRAATAQ